ncbi:hypothetical protein [Vibrio genomosp. F10]|uniref:Uncharacterized protein n=1 Tax=Vibrio genomosp. F10 str. ZF-129 TaxID=1187848 RepID=A0A1E5BAF2_9VIBR|nr:hypothetical protein [Vibrio genomosp. F10]OEE30887.1 hypothetical protein A1QO_16310 [Vibrio genomosp. F10 str. ZF-129]OEE83544.1 hypothetical protein A1QK_04115 [Vibrio genomosp. F10 str. 9ZD137]OEE98024.1 hypothetical protein A1QM_02130 [Vibrio genomosp. F10 str. 9ZC157]OEF05295.1 hypothetical protein A1QI_08005 [Vibrio genomosp. F10 str. 9ZB36]
MSLNEAYGITIVLAVFLTIYIFIHIRYIRRGEAHKAFLSGLWEMMKNTVHGQNLRAMGYKHEKEQPNKSLER